MRISDWSSDVCSSDLAREVFFVAALHECARVGKLLTQFVSAVGAGIVERSDLAVATPDEKDACLQKRDIVNDVITSFGHIGDAPKIQPIAADDLVTLQFKPFLFGVYRRAQRPSGEDEPPRSGIRISPNFHFQYTN